MTISNGNVTPVITWIFCPPPGSTGSDGSGTGEQRKPPRDPSDSVKKPVAKLPS